MRFDIDYRKLTVLLLPTALRTKRVVAMLRAFIAPLVTLHALFLASRNNTLFVLKHTSQICYMRDALNSYFGITNRADGFEITDVTAAGEFLIAYDEADYLQDRHLIIPDAPDYVLAYDESSVMPTKSFIVWCPTWIYANNTGTMPIVRAIVEQYRLVSRLPEYRPKTN